MSETIDNTQPTKATQPVNAQNPEPAQEPEGTTQEIETKPKKKWGGRIGRFLLNVLIFLIIIYIAVVFIIVRRIPQRDRDTSERARRVDHATIE